ncbi:MAG: glycosyltransferase family 4 protein [bacterium]
MKEKKLKRIILFCKELTGVGGGERLMFEEAQFFKNQNIDVKILTFKFDREVLFDNSFDINIEEVKYKHYCFLPFRLISKIFSLRKKIKELGPDLINAHYFFDTIYLFWSTLFTGIPYTTHMHVTIFWYENERSLLKYALVHRKAFREIINSVPGHRDFTPLEPPERTIFFWIKNEIIAILLYLGIKGARKIFVHSKQMQWETEKLYRKKAVSLKGAFHTDIFNYKVKKNVHAHLGLNGKKMIFHMSRLDPRKRIDLLLRAFKKISLLRDDVWLVIGGKGSDETRLKNLVRDLNITDRIIFLGYIPEQELWDYYASCDIFAYPEWIDFSLCPYEALAFGKKSIWASEMEIDDNLKKSRLIFQVDPTPDEFAKAIERALEITVNEKRGEDILRGYTWERYFNQLQKGMREVIIGGA